jgi:hypothetical protein
MPLPCYSNRGGNQQAGVGSGDEINAHCFHQLYIYAAKTEPVST